GINDGLTFGANLQGDKFSQQAGVETVFGASFALVGLNLAASSNKTGGSGYAVNAVVQTQSPGKSAQSAYVGVDYRTEEFVSLGEDVPLNPFSYQVFAGYSRELGPDMSFGATVNYSAARDGKNVESYRAGVSRSFGRNWTGSVEAVHQRRIDGASS